MNRYLIEYAGEVNRRSYGFEPQEAPLADTLVEAAGSVHDHLLTHYADNFVRAVRVTHFSEDAPACDVTEGVLRMAADMLDDQYRVHGLLVDYAPDWIRDFWLADEGYAVAAE